MANNCKYQRLKQQVSYDGGVTWQDTGIYTTGELIEEDSFECDYIDDYVFIIPNIGRSVTTALTSSGSQVSYVITSTKNGESQSYTYSAPEWVSVVISTGGVVINATSNLSNTERSGDVILTQTESGFQIRVRMTQAADPNPYIFTFDDTYTETTTSAATEGGVFVYRIISTHGGDSVSFSVLDYPSWATATVSGNTLKVVVTGNTGQIRTGNIILMQNVSENLVSVHMYQNAAYVFTFMDSTTAKTISTSKSGGAYAYQVVSTHGDEIIPYYVTSRPAWATVTINGNAVSIIVPVNQGDFRNGTVVLTQDDTYNTITVSISQSASPLTITPLDDNFTFQMIYDIQYRADGGELVNLASGVTSPAFSGGTEIELYANRPNFDISSLFGRGQISTNGDFIAAGCPNSIVYGLEWESNYTSAPAYGFMNLFRECSGLIDASGILLPAISLNTVCYAGMFNGCTNLVYPPRKLPATDMAYYCYNEMFIGCSSLIKSPEMADIQFVAGGCCESMFSGCTSLAEITCPSDLLSTGQYTRNWVAGVGQSGTFYTNNQDAWEYGVDGVPYGWTIMDYSPYTFTFDNGTREKATTASSAGGGFMYQIISNDGSGNPVSFSAVNTSDWITTSISGQNLSVVVAESSGLARSYDIVLVQDTTHKTITLHMAQETAPMQNHPLTLYTLETGFTLSAEFELQYSVNGGALNTYDPAEDQPIVFNTSGDTIELFAERSNITFEDVYDIMHGVKPQIITSGRFIAYGCPGSINDGQSWEINDDTVQDFGFASLFANSTGLTDASDLYMPATYLGNNCYGWMFYGCTSLTTAPALPAATLTEYCYNYMFYGCTSLTTAPELPATTLEERCYQEMFARCTSLNSITCLATDISAESCTSWWTDGLPSGGTFTKAASMTGWTTGVSGIPNNWTVQDYND